MYSILLVESNGFIWNDLQQLLEKLWLDTGKNHGSISVAWSLVLFSIKSKPSLSFLLQYSFLLLKVMVGLMEQRGEIPWARVLEVWWEWEQVLPSCYWTDLCHFKRLGFLHINQSVSSIWDYYIVYIMFNSNVSLCSYVCMKCFRHVLHKYANEDVSLGAWFIGIDVKHIDDRRLCCGTPPGKSWALFISCTFSRMMMLKEVR